MALVAGNRSCVREPPLIPSQAAFAACMLRRATCPPARDRGAPGVDGVLLYTASPPRGPLTQPGLLRTLKRGRLLWRGWGARPQSRTDPPRPAPARHGLRDVAAPRAAHPRGGARRRRDACRGAAGWCNYHHDIKLPDESWQLMCSTCSLLALPGLPQHHQERLAPNMLRPGCLEDPAHPLAGATTARPAGRGAVGALLLSAACAAGGANRVARGPRLCVCSTPCAVLVEWRVVDTCMRRCWCRPVPAGLTCLPPPALRCRAAAGWPGADRGGARRGGGQSRRQGPAAV